MIVDDGKRASELPSSDVLRRLNEANWDQIYPELVLYAKFRLEAISWPGGHPPGGTQAEDLAQEAIESLFIGRRNWDVVKHPNLVGVLKGIIKSLVSHQTKAKDNQTRQALSEDAGVDGWGHDALSNNPSPEESLVFKEQIAQIESLLEDDEEAGLVFLYLLENAKSQKIAEELGMPVTKVYVITRRVYRKIRDYREKTNKVD